MAFKRFAMSAINLIDTKGQRRVAFEDSVDKKVVSFEFDPENFVYFRCRAITADTPNGNGDFFPEAELKKSYKTFIGCGMYKDHDSDSVDKSVGKVLWAEWVDDGKYVECYCCVDRKLEPDLARRIEMGQANTVSMGCMVGEAICGVAGCGNVAHNQMELCEHMIPGRGIKGKKGADGKVAYEINKILQFTELSLVTVPADPTAHIFEVFASLKEGRITQAEFQKFLSEEIDRAVSAKLATQPYSPYVVIPNSNMNFSSTTTGGASGSGFITSINLAPSAIANTLPVEKNTARVERIPNSTEEQMKLNISYERGSSLANSFFVAKEADLEFRTAAADVIPLIIQDAIRSKQAGVATPAQMVADLTSKCASLNDFKKWAKKRKKKNKKAFEKMQEGKDGKPEDKKEASPAPANTVPVVASPEAPAIDPLATAPASAPANDGTALDPEAVSMDPQNDSPSGSTNPLPGATDDMGALTKEDIQNMIQELTKRLEQVQTSSAKAPQTKAVLTQKDLKTNKEMGETGKDLGGYNPAKEPAATSEVVSASEPADRRDQGKMGHDQGGGYSPAKDPMKPGSMKAEEPKGHMDAGQSTGNSYAPAKVKASQEPAMEKTAAEQGAATWSVNPKELEPHAKSGKPQQAAPQTISWNTKEMSSEQVKHEQGGHASKVKQYFGRLPSKGPGDAPHALDLKSSQDPATQALLKRAQEAEAEAARLKEKDKLQTIADKIYEIVKSLREKNVLTAGKEDEVISLLGTSFKEVAYLDAVLGLVERLAASEPQQATPEAGADIGSVVPQVFEPISETEDAISTMSKIWNS